MEHIPVHLHEYIANNEIYQSVVSLIIREKHELANDIMEFIEFIEHLLLINAPMINALIINNFGKYSNLDICDVILSSFRCLSEYKTPCEDTRAIATALSKHTPIAGNHLSYFRWFLIHYHLSNYTELDNLCMKLDRTMPIAMIREITEFYDMLTNPNQKVLDYLDNNFFIDFKIRYSPLKYKQFMVIRPKLALEYLLLGGIIDAEFLLGNVDYIHLFYKTKLKTKRDELLWQMPQIILEFRKFKHTTTQEYLMHNLPDALTQIILMYMS